jgi:O-antigen ligase
MTRPAVLRAGLPAAAATMLLAMAGAIAAGALIRHDYLALALVAGAAVALPAIVFVQRAAAWDGRAAFAMSIVLIVVQSAVFRIRDINDKSIDIQILMKLGAIAMMALMAATALARIGPRRHSGDAWVWFVFLAYGALTSLIAVRPDLSLVETASHLAAFIMLYGMARLLGRINTVNALIAACFILCLMSLAAYVGYPSLGRMSDWVNGAFVPTARLQGVFGTANAAGGAAGASLVLLLFLSDIPKNRAPFYAMVAAFSACLVLSDNRMAMAGFGVAALYIYLQRGDLALKATIGVLGIGLALIAYLGFGEELLAGLSRSGSADEITSGTGRTKIWSVVLRLWSEQPLFGYGAGSAKYILPKEPLLFKAAAHAHDLYLNILFSGGAVGLLLFLAGLWLALRRSLGRRDHGVVALLLFFMAYGITEPTIGSLASFVPMGFYAAAILALPDVNSALAGPGRSPALLAQGVRTPAPGIERPS